MIQAKKYTLLYVPYNGLFFDGGDFLDGRNDRIEWNRTIPIYQSHAQAVAAKERILAKNPLAYAGGQIIVLSVEPIEKRSVEVADELCA